MITITDKRQCCGCKACAQICPKSCIRFNKDKEGFLYPIVEEDKCIKCGLCEKTCPFLNPYSSGQNEIIYAAKSNNDYIRIDSSSGGVFSMIAEQVVLGSGVVFGARYDDGWSVVLDSTESIEGLLAFRGSKYLQADVNDAYIKCKEYLDAGRRVLFSGTPCQIAGLNHFLRKKYDNLITVDFICHGVPSPMVWSKYLSEMIPGGKDSVKAINFRNKTFGWHNYSLHINYVFKDRKSTILVKSADDLYMQAFGANMILRPSCYSCATKAGKSHSDITIADFWGIENYKPEMDDDKGTSIILVHTAAGRSAIPFDCLDFVEVSSDVLTLNEAYSKSAAEHPRRSIFYKEFDKNNLHRLFETMLRPSLSQWLWMALKHPNWFITYLHKRFFVNKG